MDWRFVLQNNLLGTLNIEPNEEPIGWDNTEFTIARDTHAHGATFAFSSDLKFRCNAYDYIYNAYLNQGVEADVFMWAYYTCEGGPETLAYYGRLNLTTVKFEATERVATCNIENIDSTVELKNRANVKVDLASLESIGGEALADYGYADYGITVLPKAVEKRAVWEKDNFATDPTTPPIIGNGTNPEFQMWTLWQQTQDPCVGQRGIDGTNWIAPGFANGLVTELDNWQGLINEAGAYGGDFNARDLVPQFIAEEAGEYTVSFCFRFDYGANYNVGGATTSPSGVDTFLRLVLRYGLNAPITIWSDNFTLNPATPLGIYGDDIVINYTSPTPIALQPGDGISLAFEGEFNGDWTCAIAAWQVNYYMGITIRDTPDLCPFTISSVIRKEPTPARAWLVNEALARVIESITDNKLTVLSSYFGRSDSQPYTNAQAGASDYFGCGRATVVTNGLRLRQYNDRPVFTSFKDLYEALRAVYGVGFGVVYAPNLGREVVRVEPYEWFYQAANSLILTDVNHRASKWVREVAPDWIYTRVLGGYEKWEPEEPGGQDEFNTPREWVNPAFRKHDNELEARCKYIASGYAIEAIRNLPASDQSTLDYKHDNEMFIIRVNAEPVILPGGFVYNPYTVNDRGVVNAANILDPNSVINWVISPWYNVLRQGFLYGIGVNQFLDGLNPAFSSLKLSYGEGNYQAAGEPFVQDICNNYGDNPRLHSEAEPPPNVQARQPKLRPEIVTFEYPLSLAQFRAISDNPYAGLLIDNEHGITERFYLLELKYKPNDFNATLKLIATR